MTKRKTLAELYKQLETLRVQFRNAETELEKLQIEKQIRLLRNRISQRERYDAMRSLGLTKTP